MIFDAFTSSRTSRPTLCCVAAGGAVAALTPFAGVSRTVANVGALWRSCLDFSWQSLPRLPRKSTANTKPPDQESAVEEDS